MTANTDMPIPTMTPKPVLEYLEAIGQDWNGDGNVVECGCWLGSTTAALSAGLERADFRNRYHCYDRWAADRAEVRKARSQGQLIQKHQDLLPMMEDNVSRYDIDYEFHKGRIQDATPIGEPIDIFLLDAAKKWKAFFRTLEIFGPDWVAGRTIVGLMDHDHYKLEDPPFDALYIHQKEFVEDHRSSFTPQNLFEGHSPSFFRYEGGIEFDKLLSDRVAFSP